MKWAFLIAMPSLIFWGVGIPLVAFLILRSKKKFLNSIASKALYGFLYIGFKP